MTCTSLTFEKMQSGKQKEQQTTMELRTNIAQQDESGRIMTTSNCTENHQHNCRHHHSKAQIDPKTRNLQIELQNHIDWSKTKACCDVGPNLRYQHQTLAH